MYVLLIEDDTALLRLYHKTLQSVGYQVIPTTTLHAIRQLHEQYAFGACIADVQMGFVRPDVHLRDLAKTALRLNLPTLIMSANIEKYTAICERYNLPYLGKPFTSQQLAVKLEEVIREFTPPTPDL